jgi:hypothetical protein
MSSINIQKIRDMRCVLPKNVFRIEYLSKKGKNSRKSTVLANILAILANILAKKC